MARFTASEKQLKPDPRYQDLVVSKFINCIMEDGKKATAMRVVYDAFDVIQARLDAGESFRTVYGEPRDAT